MSLRPNVFIRAMAVSLSNAFIALNHRCNNLNGQYEEDHCNGVDRCIGHAWNIAVCHGVCGCQAGSTRHATGNGSQQVENTDFEDQSAHDHCYQHGEQCNGCAYSKQEPTAFLKSGYQILSGRCTHFGKEKQESQLPQQLVGGP